MDNLNEKLDSLKKQQEQAREMFIKCQGAIEFVESLIQENEKPNEKGKK